MKVLGYLFLMLTSLGVLEARSIKAVIFDCDGTLVDNGHAEFLDWHYALKCQEYELQSEEFWQFMSKHNLLGNPNCEKAIIQYYCGLIGRDCQEEIRKAFSESPHPGHAYPPIASTVNFLHQLTREKEQRGIKLGLASAGSKEHIYKFLEHLNLLPFFDVIVSGKDDLDSYDDAEGKNKPKPYVYLHAAKLLGVSPEECVAIEDSRAGLLSAAGAGCFAVAVPNTRTRYQDLSPAHLQVDSFADFSPETFFQRVKALIPIDK